MARWERRFQGGGIYTLFIGPGWWHQPVLKDNIGTGWSHKPVLKAFFSIPKGGKQRPLVPVGGINWYQCYPLVTVGRTNRYIVKLWYRLVTPTGTARALLRSGAVGSLVPPR